MNEERRVFIGILGGRPNGLKFQIEDKTNRVFGNHGEYSKKPGEGTEKLTNRDCTRTYDDKFNYEEKFENLHKIEILANQGYNDGMGVSVSSEEKCVHRMPRGKVSDKIRIVRSCFTNAPDGWKIKV
ncbi:hypothetical protein ACFX2G_034979 [Malus domestica]